jgi:hypothetical protein
MLLLSAITTAALIAGWSHNLGLALFLTSLALAVLVGLGLRAVVSLVAGTVRNRRSTAE